MIPFSLPLTMSLLTMSTSDAPMHTLTLGQMVAGSGVCGWLVLLLAAASLIMAVRRIVELRSARLAPSELQRALELEIHAGDLGRAAAAASGHSSLLGRIASAGLRQHPLGLDEMLANIERTATKEAMRIGGRVANLSRVGIVALLVGFLGSALGLVFALRATVTMLPIEATNPVLYQSLAIAGFPVIIGLTVALFSYAAFSYLDHRLTQRTLHVREIAEEMAYLVDAGRRRGAEPTPAS